VLPSGAFTATGDVSDSEGRTIIVISICFEFLFYSKKLVFE
jgi:hypothetical protein